MSKTFKSMGIYVAIIIVFLLAIGLYTISKPGAKPKSYSTIIGYFEDNQVKSFSLDFNTSKLTLTMVNSKIKPFDYTVASIPLFVKDTKDYIAAYDAQHKNNRMVYDYIPQQPVPWWLDFLPYAILTIIMIGFFYFMMNRVRGEGGGKAMSFGKARVKQGQDEKNKTTFNDVAGADEEKEELMEIVDFLKNPRKYNELGAHIPKGVLLVGPPGTGKTLIARAVSGEAGVPFFSISGSDFVEMFVGVGASRVRDLFDQAKKSSPCIIFIDEIDAVGRQRGAGLGGGHDEREQTLNQLLVEMDGFGANEGVIIIAATNRPDILDSALLRPGRFDRQVFVGLPDVKGREEILKVHSKNKPLAADVELSTIAKTTAGFTGADLENLLNEAALLAARFNKKEVSMQEIQESTIKVIAGPEKRTRVVSDKDRKLTAYHEAGHAIVTHFLPTQDPVHEISIIPRGRAGGYTLSLPKDDKYYSSKSEMFEEVVSLLGGRVSEKLALDDISTGASNDIERATTTARKMITKYGMSERLGPIVYGSGHDEVFLGRDFAQSRNYSENVAAQIDEEIKSIIDSAYEKAKDILTENMSKLHEVAQALIATEKLDAKSFQAIFAASEGIIFGSDYKAPADGENA